MSSRANVRSIASVEQFKAMLVRFEEDASAAASILHQDIVRFLDWLEHDRPAFWRQQVRRAFDEVNEARSELNRKQMITVAGHRPECIEEKQALERAKRRLQFAQEKVQVVRQWNTKANHEVGEYSAQLGRLEQSLSHELPRMVALLERILNVLESYAETGSPSTAEPEELADRAASRGESAADSSASTQEEN